MGENIKKNIFAKNILLIISIVFFIAGAFVQVFMLSIIIKKGIFSYIPLFIGDMIMIVSMFILYAHLNIEHIDKEFSLYEKYLIQELESKDKSENGKDVIRLMLKNNKEITEYFSITKKQEKKSYNISICCSIVGIIMLIVAIVGVLYSAKIEITVITIVSGALTEVVSGMVLWIHGKSAEQLNHYYEALHENEKFLSAINLADKLKDKTKEQMYIEIIRAQIEARGEKEKEEN